ncbi:hypothetical protein GPJ56_003481 [Histomonas meleagridis]|uniref:uncharacterized protein n=1 Tax=Histomonas meleagridis TaxID=135588 RepID=UPI00355A4DAC|nr:hypothetical protein GPJ56_003481 [Histomonas meleagridis]KAH0799173.1 hypothetical protein GO595_007970 [Histomonas meleagridis]
MTCGLCNSLLHGTTGAALAISLNRSLFCRLDLRKDGILYPKSFPIQKIPDNYSRKSKNSFMLENWPDPFNYNTLLTYDKPIKQTVIFPSFLYTEPNFSYYLRSHFGGHLIYYLQNYFMYFSNSTIDYVQNEFKKVPKNLKVLGIHIRTHRADKAFITDETQLTKVLYPFLDDYIIKDKPYLFIAVTRENLFKMFEEKYGERVFTSDVKKRPDGRKADAVRDLACLMMCDRMVGTYRSTFSVLAGARALMRPYYVTMGVDYVFRFTSHNQYLKGGGDKARLLALGQKLFGKQSSAKPDRKSYKILQAKEYELTIPKVEKERVHRTIQRAPLPNIEQPPTPDQFTERILAAQDKNGVLLYRCKSLNRQKSAMDDRYNTLMDKSVQQKVQLKHKMRRLKSELDEALTKSRPKNSRNADLSQKMNELSELNQQIIGRINSFKIFNNNNRANYQKAVLSRYKPRMEKLLGQIYPHSDNLSLFDIHNKFESISEKIEIELQEIEIQLRNEHDRNDQLQKESLILKEQENEQKEVVNRIKSQNMRRAKELDLLKVIAEREIHIMKEEYDKKLNLCDDSDDKAVEDFDEFDAAPSSARAVVVTTGRERREIKRSPSQKALFQRDAICPKTIDVEECIEKQKTRLLEMISQSIV